MVLRTNDLWVEGQKLTLFVSRCTSRRGVRNSAYWQALACSLVQLWLQAGLDAGGVIHCGAGRQRVFFDRAADCVGWVRYEAGLIDILPSWTGNKASSFYVTCRNVNGRSSTTARVEGHRSTERSLTDVQQRKSCAAHDIDCQSTRSSHRDLGNDLHVDITGRRLPVYVFSLFLLITACSILIYTINLA